MQNVLILLTEWKQVETAGGIVYIRINEQIVYIFISEDDAHPWSLFVRKK